MGWQTPPQLWTKLKPLAREMRGRPTPAEARLWSVLRGGRLRGFKFRRQHAIESCIVDFYCAEAALVIEVDGSSHDSRHEADSERDRLLESRGLHVMRFSNNEVLRDLNGVLGRIEDRLAGNRGGG